MPGLEFTSIIFEMKKFMILSLIYFCVIKKVILVNLIVKPIRWHMM